MISPSSIGAACSSFPGLVLVETSNGGILHVLTLNQFFEWLKKKKNTGHKLVNPEYGRTKRINKDLEGFNLTNSIHINSQVWVVRKWGKTNVTLTLPNMEQKAEKPWNFEVPYLSRTNPNRKTEMGYPLVN